MKKKKLKTKGRRPTEECPERKTDGREELYFYFLLFISSQIHGNLTVGIRRDKHEKCSMRRGPRVGTKNKGFHRNSGKNLEKSKFLVFLRFTAF